MTDEPTIQVKYIDAEGEIATTRVRSPVDAANWVIKQIQEIGGLHPGDLFLVTGSTPLELARETNTKVSWNSNTNRLEAT